MKKLFVFLTAIAVIASLTSCLEQCEIDKAGEVTITNDTGVNLWFDVTGEDGSTNENRFVAAGASTTYTMPEGTVKVWASLTSNNEDFWLVNTQSLAKCGTVTFQTPTHLCALFNVTTVEMVNNTGYVVFVDIRQGEFLYGQTYLDKNESVTYQNVWAGATIDIGIRIPYVADAWYWDTKTITSCTPASWTWNPYSAKELMMKSQGVEEPITVKFQRPTKK